MIRVLPLRLTFEPESGVHLPAFPGAIWRSAFGARLRRDACITGADRCDGCSVRQRCAYGAVFEPIPTPQSQGLSQRFRDLPRPYVISPVHRGGFYGAGQRLSLDLILTAPAFGHLKAAERAFSRLHIHGTPMRLVEAQMRSPQASDGSPEDASIDANGYNIVIPAVPETVRVVLEHPLRLRRDNRNVGTETFRADTFFSALLRRISSLYEAANSEPMDVNYRRLLDHAREHIRLDDTRLAWIDAERHSSRQARNVPIGGVVGSFTLTGNLEPLWPWLWVGQWTHVGKGAVMGLGRYRLDQFAV